MKTVLRKVCLIKKLVNMFFFWQRIRKIPYVSRLLPLHQWEKATVNYARDITKEKIDNMRLFVHAD